ncbi:oxidoreductase [Mycobacterium montefiorense]|uniref:Short-chain dehydrogenase n=1 Tax=Mycobacterium montefiorense TaxID=154654 RepID=A0AA37PQY4_9MYCO|nr:oxidoreductase [Mycobacterium montefiorense]GBG39326.1 short-chain dehydrogenase [Mycobacterium montefiorense]GKU37477.1 short-chain dehydrogenase [Mycobacterium montefiorense]GKU42332.1 short-chain dehydrogenase [Mycobacterium montefiorense]GKU44264.1 short-chain dehydrogenase [Mycobacterium montefiorense]GKU53257.1 short-chain dehydrogenase [Mycobacterium montefiorense]
MTDWTAVDLPSFAGRTVIVTGANSGLGAITARELARTGAHVILAVRTPSKGEAAAAQMPGDVEVRQLDLQDLASVHQFADGIAAADLLINNAGIMAHPFELTADGFESQIGTNHFGHFALTNLLLPKLTDRVVTLTSMGHWLGRIDFDDINWKTRRYSPWSAYSQSKLANLLFTSELQRRLRLAGSPLRSVAAHPGYATTNLHGATGRKVGDAVMLTATRVFAVSADFGAQQTLYAASQDLPGDTYIGPKFGYLGRTQLVSRSRRAQDPTTAAALWELSEQLTGVEFPL